MTIDLSRNCNYPNIKDNYLELVPCKFKLLGKHVVIIARKGNYSIAQGNALGNNGLSDLRPERATIISARVSYLSFIVALTGRKLVIWLIPRALPWAKYSWPFRPIYFWDKSLVIAMEKLHLARVAPRRCAPTKKCE